MQPEWFTVISLVGVVESTIALSFLPAYRSNWKRWKGIDWDAEFPFVAPSYSFNGGAWFLLGFFNALALWRLIRQDQPDEPFYHVAISLWLASFFLLSLWAIPFEFKTPIWSFVSIFLSSILSFACASFSLALQRHDLSPSIMLFIYSTILFVPSLFQLLIFLVRHSDPDEYDKLKLHKKTANPIWRYWKEQGWPPATL